MLGPPQIDGDTRNLFRQAEIRAEYLIAWMRLGISSTLLVAILLSLYFTEDPVGPVLRSQDVLLWQIIYALFTMGSYFLLGLGCILLIRRNRFRNWMIWPSAGGDCLFILISTWLSLANTGLNGEYIVVLPTLWLVPVVLACGVLRFNPALQAFILILLVAGFLFIDQLAAQFPAVGDPAVLEFFFAGPPNAMRMVMVTIAGIVLVVATYRTRALFRRTLSETERRINLTRYLPAEVAPDLSQSGMNALETGSRQMMAVMFVDMRGFTARAENMSAEDLTQFVTKYRRHVTEIARAHGGIIDKFMGDAVMIVFPDDPEASSPPAREALAAGQGVVSVIDAWAHDELQSIRVGVGVHWGEVFAGVIGDEERLEYSVFGDTVNTAARLEELTKQRHIPMIASAATLDAAGGDLTEWKALPPADLRGRTNSLEIFGWAPEDDA